MPTARFRLRPALFAAWFGALALSFVATARAAEDAAGKAETERDTLEAPVGPRRGAGERKVGANADKAAAAKNTAQKAEPRADQEGKTDSKTSPTKPAATKPKKVRTHRVGRPPRSPKPVMPEGVPKKEPDEGKRRHIAGGPTQEEREAGLADPELLALKQADRILFPKPLSGFTPGWSWGLPAKPAGDAPTVEASGLPPSASLSSDDEQAQSDAEWLRSLTLPDLPVRFDARVIKYLKFYRDTARGRNIARVWARKSGRYAAALRAEVAKAGLPKDLIWLSLIESGHNPIIHSPVGAAGLWQFMPATGRMYGLTVDRWVDERLDPERSTQAAVRFLSDLHRRFGNWELAMAAYNMGYGGLSRAIRKFSSNDFWELSRYEAGIPWETTLYVPKIFAIAVVMNNKKAFGIDDITPDPPVSFDTVLVGSGTPLSDVAKAADVPVAALKALNPQYLASRTPPAEKGEERRWPVHVPSGSGLKVAKKLAKSGPGSELVPYRWRFGDTFEDIAESRGTTARKLQRVNGIGDESIKSGTIVLVPRADSATKEAASDQPDAEVVVVPARKFEYEHRKRVFYRTQSGDSLDRVASEFGVTRAELLAWNALDDSARLQSGLTLQVYVPKSAQLDHVRYVAEADARVLVAGEPEFYEYHEGLKGKKRMLVAVRKGDTLRSIGNRYGMSIGWMERVNRRSRSSDLTPGEKVVVYTERHVPEPGGARAKAGTELSPLPAVEAPAPNALPPLPKGAKSTAEVSARQRRGSQDQTP